MATFRLEEVSVYHKDERFKTAVAALFEVSLVIKDGLLTVVKGPSGAGKTTLLKVIAGTLSVDEGKVFKDHLDITDLSTDKRGCAFVTQEHTLYPHLTVFDNIAFPLRQAAVPLEEIRVRVKEIAKSLGLSLVLSRKPRVLSKGQQQMVAIARAIIRRPDVMLLDEPFANVDLMRRIALKEFLLSLQKTLGLTIVLVTHDEDDVINLGDVTITVENGAVIDIRERKIA